MLESCILKATFQPSSLPTFSEKIPSLAPTITMKMENQEQFQELENNQTPQLKVTEDMRSYIYDMAKWANFLGIVGVVISIFMLMGALVIGPTLKTNPELAKMMGQLGHIDGSILSVVFFIYALAFFYPSFLLVKYAAKAKQGVLYGDQHSLDEGFRKLKSLFKYFGVLTIIITGLYLMTIFGNLFGRVS